MKRIFLILSFLISSLAVSAQYDRISVIVLRDMDGFDMQLNPNVEITSQTQECTIIAPWATPVESVSQIVRNALNESDCDWLTLTNVQHVIIHDQGNYITRTQLTFRADNNLSTKARMAVFICPDAVFNKNGAGIIQKAGSSSRQIFNISSTNNVVYPGQRITIHVDGSEPNVNYSLHLYGQEIDKKTGTGSALSFTGDYGAGLFRVLAYSDGDVSYMNGEIFLEYYQFILEEGIAFSESEIVFPREGGSQQIAFMFLNPNYVGELEEVLQSCNRGENERWDPAIRFSQIDLIGGMYGFSITAPANEADTTRISNLIIGKDVYNHDGSIYRQIMVSQKGYPAANIYAIEGPQMVKLGESFSILLNGSQTGVSYNLYRSGTQIQTLAGTGSKLLFSGLTQSGNYTVVADYNNRRTNMEGNVFVKLYSDSEVNYITESFYPNDAERIIETTYYDEQSRPIQRNHVAASPDGSDLITPILYDEKGRISKNYLAFPYLWGYVENADIEQEAIYEMIYGWGQEAYTEYQFDGTPTDRVLKKSIPGYLEGLDVSEIFDYRKNSGTDNIKKFILNGTSVTMQGNYPDLSLKILDIYNAEWNNVTEYYDDEGKLLARKNNDACTYYIYDDLGMLRYVFPPLQDLEFTSGSRTLEQLRKYSFYYEYNEEGQIYKKYMPGAEPVIYLYDKRGRQALWQDGNMRLENKWMFTHYDVLNRPVVIGSCTGSEAEHKSALERQTVFFEYFEDDLYSLFPVNFGGYTNNTYPRILSEKDMMTILYYDNYEWENYGLKPFSQVDAFGETPLLNVKGKLTGIKERIIYDNDNIKDWLVTSYYYNGQYNMIQSVKEHYDFRIEVCSHQYNLADNIVHSKIVHKSGNYNDLFYERFYEYDSRQRPVKVKQKIEDDGAGLVTLSYLLYDEFGRVSDKGMHNEAVVMEFEYDIRDKLLSVTSEEFSYQLGYDNPSLPGSYYLYDGNISEFIWKNREEQKRGYSYNYDRFGRLTSASFFENDHGNWTNPSQKFNVENITYDANGNLTGLVRKDKQGGILNRLQYNYANSSNGNVVSTITDNNIVSEAYLYDKNGNMIYDGKRGMEIEYNFLNLPIRMGGVKYIYTTIGRKIAVLGDKKIYYIGEGIYKKKPLEAEEVYLVNPEGFVKLDDLSNYYTQNRYYYRLSDYTGSTRVLLGLNREGELEKVQEVDYYPFGLAFEYDNPDVNNFLFSNKELQQPLMYDEVSNLYDFGSRFYDPVVGRWSVPDPQAENYYFLSPYSFAANNPILFTDQDGESIWITHTDPKTGNFYAHRYTPGEDYTGDNEFIKEITELLNDIYNYGGTEVILTLAYSSNRYDISNEFVRNRRGQIMAVASFVGNGRGGKIKLGYWQEMERNPYINKIDNVAHEIFHAFQHAHGRGGASIYNEIEAYVFGQLISSEYFFNAPDIDLYEGVGSKSLGRRTLKGEMYNENFSKLIDKNTFSQEALLNTIFSFKYGSEINRFGTYNSYPLFNFNTGFGGNYNSLLYLYYPTKK